MWRLAFVSAFLLLAFENSSLAQDCGADPKSCSRASFITCANGAMCPSDRKCSSDGRRCLAMEMVDCGTYSCGPGKVCGPGSACLVKRRASGRRFYALNDARLKDSRPAQPSADKAVLAYVPEQDKTQLRPRPFSDSRAGAAQSTPAPAPAAKAPPANPATPPAATIEDAHNSSSTVTSIKELQAEIKRAEESKTSAEQEIKKLQTKMQELSLKRWQETADQIRAAAASQMALVPNAENMKLNCKFLRASDTPGEKFQLQCERQQVTTCDAGPRAK